MKSQRILSFALTASAVSAFQDTSPFFMFSTSVIHDPANLGSLNLASSRTVNSHVEKMLSSCPSEAYIIVTQPAVSAHDFGSRSAAPHLRNALNGTDGPLKTAIVVPEVYGLVEAQSVISLLEDKCGARVVSADAATGEIPNESANPRIVKVAFSLLPEETKDRASKMGDNDSFLHAVISTVGGHRYTVIYTTTPPSIPHLPGSAVYEMDHPYDSAPHIELKRDVNARPGSSADSNLPLFEKYVFFSPGIFMGLFVGLILFSIFYVGISALGSLQVSYYAFSKEMGPSAQKKQ